MSLFYLKAGEGVAAQSVSYQYNTDGLRVSKTADGVTTHYTLHGKLITHLKKGSDQMHFFYDGQGKPAMVKLDGAFYTYVHNLQGDIVAILDAANTKVVEYKYDAWGKPTSTWSLVHATDSTLTTEYAKLAALNPFRYRGYIYDQETGLYYLRSRYYDPVWGRFLNTDTIIGVHAALLMHNSFAYCRNMPIDKSDPDGLSAISTPIIWDILTLAAVSAKVPGDSSTEIVSQLKEIFYQYNTSCQQQSNCYRGSSRFSKRRKVLLCIVMHSFNTRPTRLWCFRHPP